MNSEENMQKPKMKSQKDLQKKGQQIPSRRTNKATKASTTLKAL
jgi:hypothetical protein